MRAGSLRGRSRRRLLRRGRFIGRRSITRNIWKSAGRLRAIDDWLKKSKTPAGRRRYENRIGTDDIHRRRFCFWVRGRKDRGALDRSVWWSGKPAPSET